MVRIGKRSTKSREAVFQALIYFKKPVSVKEIFNHLKKTIDITSIYRTLKLMENLSLVNEIEFGDGKKRYELIKDKNHHHHHLVCEKCGYIESIEMEEEDLLKNIKSNFFIKKHKLEFFGLCPNCQ